jgi:hypothetical protein
MSLLWRFSTWQRAPPTRLSAEASRRNRRLCGCGQNTGMGKGVSGEGGGRPQGTTPRGKVGGVARRVLQQPCRFICAGSACLVTYTHWRCSFHGSLAHTHLVVRVVPLPQLLKVGYVEPELGLALARGAREHTGGLRTEGAHLPPSHPPPRETVPSGLRRAPPHEG